MDIGGQVQAKGQGRECEDTTLLLFYLSLKDSSSIDKVYTLLHTKSTYLLQEKIKCMSVKCGIWLACFIKKQGQQRVKHRRNRNKVCGLCSHPGNRLLGCSRRSERLEPTGLQLLQAPRFFKDRS